jgi:hypothetical protein
MLNVSDRIRGFPNPDEHCMYGKKDLLEEESGDAVMQELRVQLQLEDESLRIKSGPLSLEKLTNTREQGLRKFCPTTVICEPPMT